MKTIQWVFLAFTLGFSLVASPITLATGIKSQPAQATSDGTEYWAVLVGCNEFKNRPDLALQGNDVLVGEMRTLLLRSDHWQSDHIKMLTGPNATKRNILSALRWLVRMVDEDDICLFSIATHGINNKDIFPKDEVKQGDAYLLTYDTYRKLPIIGIFQSRYTMIRDDELNFYFNRLNCKGICAIIGSCYSGGFDDNYKGTGHGETQGSASRWMKNIGDTIGAPGRVILMACEDDSMSLGDIFERYLMEGLKGFGDFDADGRSSAEEAFDYAKPRTVLLLRREFDFPQVPQIYDSYTGNLLLTDNELPPGRCAFTGPIVAQTGMDIDFTISSIDQDEDEILYTINWNDGLTETTNLTTSGSVVNLHHKWDSEGTYWIKFTNSDEHGVSRWIPGNQDSAIIVITNDRPVDQRQTETYEEQHFNDVMIPNTKSTWYAQSFVTSQTILSKVDIPAIVSMVFSQTPGPIHLSIRNNLTGPDLTGIVQMPMQVYDHSKCDFNYTTFDFPDINVNPGQTYYIVLRFDDNGILGGWAYAGLYYTYDPDYGDDPYPTGKPYFSIDNGLTWIEEFRIYDFCFVTYG